MIYRDTLNGVKSELFCDYGFFGISNQDPIDTITASNDYTYALIVNGNVNISEDLFINGDRVIQYNSSNDTRLLQNMFMGNLLVKSIEPTITFQTTNNSIDK